MNFEKIVKNVKNIDKKIVKIMKNGIKISFVFCLIACMILVVYIINSRPDAYYIGTSLFKSSLFYICAFIICGFAFNKISNDFNS